MHDGPELPPIVNFAPALVEDEIRAYRVTTFSPFEVSLQIAKGMEARGVNVAKLIDEGALKVVRPN